MFSSAGGSSLALHAERKSSDDSPSCLENPRPAGAESTLTENVASPFQAEPRQDSNLHFTSVVLALRSLPYLNGRTLSPFPAEAEQYHFLSSRSDPSSFALAAQWNILD